MTKGLVSIIIPVYNVTNYIDECLESVIKQTYTDIEVVIIDDFCTDGTMDKVEQIIRIHHGSIPFKIAHHNYNRGQSAARNTGMDMADGEFLYFLDSDDYIFPYCIKLLVECINQANDIDWVCGNYAGKKMFSSWLGINTGIYHNVIKLHSLGLLLYVVWNCLYKAEFIRIFHFRFAEGIIHEDELWIFFVIKKLKRLAIVNHPTYIYNTTDNSIMAKTSKILSAKHNGIILAHISRNMDEPFFSLQLYRYLSNYIDNFHYARFSSNYWIAMPRFLIGLLKEGEEKLAVLFFTYIILSPFFCWQRLRNIIFNHVTSLWAIASREAGKSFI